jgi:hypothetical protein
MREVSPTVRSAGSNPYYRSSQERSLLCLSSSLLDDGSSSSRPVSSSSYSIGRRPPPVAPIHDHRELLDGANRCAALRCGLATSNVDFAVRGRNRRGTVHCVDGPVDTGLEDSRACRGRVDVESAAQNWLVRRGMA